MEAVEIIYGVIAFSIIAAVVLILRHCSSTDMGEED